MLKLLYVSGGLFVLSLFTFNEIFLTVALTLFVIAVVLNCYKLWKGQDVFNVVADKSFDNAKKHFKNKQYGKAAVYSMAFPMVVTGVVMAILILCCMWYMSLGA